MSAPDYYMTDAEIQAMIDQARTWINVKFRHQGRSRFGVDCVGLFACVAGELGRPDPIPANYSREPDSRLLLAELRKRFEEIKINETRPGDFLVMHFENVKGVMDRRHLALRTDKGIIHSAAMYRKVTEHGLTPEWANRVVTAFRIPRRTE
jgi:cell wall-associated NlpC family hydrolase